MVGTIVNYRLYEC